MGSGDVGLFAGIALILVGWLASGFLWPDDGSDSQEAATVAPATSSARSKSARPSEEHAPPRPSSRLVEPWSPRGDWVEVAGEAYRGDAVRRLFTAHGLVSNQGAEINGTACLVCDPGNPHDENAVAVYVEGHHLGYLERPQAARYHQPLAALAGSDSTLSVRSRTWARFEGSRAMARVSLYLPDPDGLAPAVGAVPEAGVVLPTGPAVQVTRENEHLDVLSRHVRAGATVAVAVTLAAVTEQRARSKAEIVEVQLEGDRVGVLSPTQTANFKPLVDFLVSRGRVPVARAILAGNQLKADLTLYASKAQEVEPAWLEAVETGTGPQH
jgi:hypothetical protein